MQVYNVLRVTYLLIVNSATDTSKDPRTKYQEPNKLEIINQKFQTCILRHNLLIFNLSFCGLFGSCFLDLGSHCLVRYPFCCTICANSWASNSLPDNASGLYIPSLK